MTPKILSLAAAAALAVGTALPAAAATPAPAGAAAPAKVLQTAPSADAGRVIQVRHYNRYGRYCRRQYRLGFVLGRHGARVIFRRHCRGRHWDRGYHGRWRHHRRHHRRHWRRDWRYSR